MESKGLEDAVVMSIFGAWGEGRQVSQETVLRYWNMRGVTPGMAERAIERAKVAVQPSEVEYPGRAAQP
jgi:hypothetical protein